MDGSPLPHPDAGKNPHAVSLGKLGGDKGGKARAKARSPAAEAIAKKAARIRRASDYVAASSMQPRKAHPTTMPTRDVEVEIYFLPTEHGGRKTPAVTGYRPQFYYRGHDWDAQHEYPDSEAVMPGQSAPAYLMFVSPAAHLGNVIEGMPFLREGNSTIGYGCVRKIIDLEKSAAGDPRPGQA